MKIVNLDPINQRLNACTPGEWEVCPMGMYIFSKDGNMVADVLDLEDGPPGTVMRPRGVGAGKDQENAAFIAHAKTDISELILEVVDRRARDEESKQFLKKLWSEMSRYRAGTNVSDHMYDVLEYLQGLIEKEFDRTKTPENPG